MSSHLQNPSSSKRSRSAGVESGQSSASSATESPWRGGQGTALRAVYESAQPFPHLRLRDVFPTEMARGARAEIQAGALPWTSRRNDLYSFSQSPSLASNVPTGSCLAKLRDEIYSESFRQWVSVLTGVGPLAATVDASAALYSRGDHLLCHDDDLAGRAVAFIVYLTHDGWCPTDGGALALYQCDEKSGSPTVVASALGAHFNSMTLFAVTPISFHAVQEVRGSDARISISGWFHAATQPRTPVAHPVKKIWAQAQPPAALLPGDGADFTVCGLSSWVHSRYRSDKARLSIARAFVESGGSLQLGSFLSPGPLRKLHAALTARSWRSLGPPSERNFRVCMMTGQDEPSTRRAGTEPDAVDAVFAMFSSLEFLEFVKFIADGIGEDLSGEVSASVVAFSSGDYSLITDETYKRSMKISKAMRAGVDAAISKDSEAPSADAATDCGVIEMSLCVLAQGAEDRWPDDAGGASTYLTADEEIACFAPQGNCLSIALRAPGVYSFTKYVSAQAPETLFRIDLCFQLKN
jgi:Rps23 Pro-64 3,4-dihydroxylase Tpa1-like proline 4-hydroxylase